MRLAPVPMFFYTNLDAGTLMSGESFRTTHGAAECIEAGKLFGVMLFMALSGSNKKDILLAHSVTGLESKGIRAIVKGAYRKVIKNIRGSGYVIESLGAALWCFHHTDTFQDAILKATNMGNDADTTAAIRGQLAGAYYGESGIPDHWKQ